MTKTKKREENLAEAISQAVKNFGVSLGSIAIQFKVDKIEVKINSFHPLPDGSKNPDGNYHFFVDEIGYGVGGEL